MRRVMVATLHRRADVCALRHRDCCRRPWRLRSGHVATASQLDHPRRSFRARARSLCCDRAHSSGWQSDSAFSVGAAASDVVHGPRPPPRPDGTTWSQRHAARLQGLTVLAPVRSTSTTRRRAPSSGVWREGAKSVTATERLPHLSKQTLRRLPLFPERSGSRLAGGSNALHES
jgi:hypothetical protein